MNTMTANEVWDEAIRIARAQSRKSYDNFQKIKFQYHNAEEAELEFAAYESAQSILTELIKVKVAQDLPM